LRIWQQIVVDVTWKYEFPRVENNESWEVELTEDLIKLNNKFNRNFPNYKILLG